MSFARRHPLWVIFFLALVARALFVILMRPDPFGMIDSREYDAAARHLLAGGGFSDGLGFVRPPLYPLFLAASYLVDGVAILQVAQVLLGAATAVLVAALARELARVDWAAVAAGLIAAVYPWFFQFVGGLASETLFTFLAVASFTLILRAARGSGLGLLLLAGALFGVAALARTNMLTLAPPVALWWWWRSRGLVRPAIFGAGIILALLPFSAYNLAAGNGLVVSSNGGGISFAIGNNPESALLYGGTLSDAEWREMSANAGRTESALRWFGCRYVDDWRGLCAERVGIAERERFFYEAGFRYIRTYPAEWALLEIQKFLHYWRPWADPRAYSLPIVFVSGFSFAAVLALALAGMTRLGRYEAGFVLVVAVTATLTAMLWAVQLRYRFALLDPVLIAAAGSGAQLLLGRVVGRISPRATPYSRTVSAPTRT